MEKRGEKLEAARGKLAKQKPPKKPGPVRRIGRAAGGAAHGFVHGKIYENEQENVGIEGAHRSELVGESALRHGSRFVKRKVREHPAKAVRRAESKYVKATADYHFRMAAQEHPEMSGNPLSRMWRKHRLKKQYQKRAREAVKTGTAGAAKKTAAAAEKAGAKAAGFVKRHPVGVVLALACVLLLFMMQSCSSSLVTLGNAGAGAVGATTYPSQDEEMLAAEAAYVGMEAELQDYLDSYESTHDYDEYHFDLDSIEHDPYVLISILSVLHEGEWTLSQVEAPCKPSLTASTFSPRMWWWRCGIGRKPDGQRGQFLHGGGALQLLHLLCHAGKPQPVPSAPGNDERGADVPVLPLYVHPGEPA